MPFSSSVTSSTSESSLYSSPCSSPTSSLPQPSSLQQGEGESRVAVPFLWEEKPGISKPSQTSARTCIPPSSSSSTKFKSSTSRHILYGKSLEFPPLPPPPRLSQAFLSQPRSRESKLLNTPSLPSRRKPLAETISFKKPSSKDDHNDPFFLALKACTKENKSSSRREKASFDRLQAALRGFFKPTKREQYSSRSKGTSSKECDEDSSKHAISREGSTLSAGSKSQPVPAAGQCEPVQGVARKSSRKKNLGGADDQGHYSKPLARVSAKVGHCTESSSQLGPMNGEAPAGSNHLIKVVEFNSGHGHANSNIKHHLNPCLFTDLLGCKALPPLNAPAIHPSLIFPKKLLMPP